MPFANSVIPNPTAPNTYANRNMTKTSEDKLFELSKWTFLSIRLTGYWPLSLTINPTGSGERMKSFEVKRWSFHTFNLFLHIMLYAYWFYIYTSQFGTSLKPFLSESIAIIALSFWSGLLILCVVLLKFTCFCQRHDSLKFWNQTVQLYNEMDVTVKNVFGNYSISDQFFRIAGREIRNTMIVHLGMALFYLFYTTFVHVYVLRTVQLEKYYFVLLLILSVVSHSANGPWLCLFIKIYTAGYGIIDKCLEECFNGNKNAHLFLVNDDNRKSQLELPQSVSASMLCKKLEMILKLFESIDREIKHFNHHFWFSLLIQVLLSTAIILVYGFFLCVYGDIRNGFLLGVIVQPLVLYWLDLYSLCTLSGILTQKALETVEQLQKFYPIDFDLDTNLQLKVLIPNALPYNFNLKNGLLHA